MTYTAPCLRKANTTPPRGAAERERRTIPMDEDLVLIRRVAAGDRQAFEMLYRRYTQPLAGYLTKLLHQRELVEEVLDDVTLDDRERASVQAHLMTCAACQAELARCHDLAAAVRAAAADGWEPSTEHFARVLARLDATPASAAPRRGWWDTVRALYERYGAMLHRTPPLIRWTLVAQSAFTLVFAGMLVWQAPWAPPERFYRTLSSSSDQTAQKRTQIHVVFADDITAKELRALLTEVRGTIVAGPSPLGVYTVAVALSGDVRAPADIALATLRAHPKVRLAEALDTR